MSTKMKTVPVELEECHLFECPNCYEKNLIVGESPCNGDHACCIHCSQKLKVVAIIGSCRADGNSTLQTMRPEDLI